MQRIPGNGVEMYEFEELSVAVGASQVQRQLSCVGLLELELTPVDDIYSYLYMISLI
jgi:hypothetical protein